jgi:hypothetical protein
LLVEDADYKSFIAHECSTENAFTNAAVDCHRRTAPSGR